MRLRSGWLKLSLILLAVSTFAQLPPAQRLSTEDEREFSKELKRLEALLSTANDNPAIELQIANTYAARGQFPEAIRLLRRVVEQNLGFDPSRDPDFAKLRGTTEFQSIMDEVHQQTPPIHNSRLIALLEARDIRPESIAFDVKRTSFILGNTARFELVRCALRGACYTFVAPNAGEKGYALGLKVDAAHDAVWATNNTASTASLRCYDLETGKLQRTAAIAGGHVFNDLTVSSTGTVYVTDTAEDSVYKLPAGMSTLERMAPQHAFTAANGIAISADGRLLYVSTWEDGIDVIDLHSEAVTPMVHPDDICLAFIDGLYSTQRSLIAIQNGPMLPRIVQLGLNSDGTRIESMRILERRNPLFDGITTGVIVGKQLYYIANPQTDKKNGTRLDPLRLLALPLVP